MPRAPHAAHAAPCTHMLHNVHGLQSGEARAMGLDVEVGLQGGNRGSSVEAKNGYFLHHIHCSKLTSTE